MNPLLDSGLSEVRKLIQNHSSFAILSHVRPDGDAYGTSLAFAHLLRSQGKKVEVYNEDGLSPLFEFLPGSSEIKKTPATPPSDDTILIAVDTASLERLGPTFQSWSRKPDLNLDHHISNTKYGKLNWIDATSPASAQVLSHLAQKLEIPLSSETASCLYIGIMTDTGSFRYRQTTAETFEVAGKLIRAGADPTELAQACYQNYPASRLLLQKEVLHTVQFAHENQIAFCRLTPDMFKRSGATSEETEGLIESLQVVKTVEVAFILEEMPGGIVRASLRSRGKIDVQKIASQFGGGGHTLAAGIRSKLPAEEFEQKILNQIITALKIK